MSCDKPLISVVINNYNYAQYVGEAIESVLAQTYGNVEILCVDDGSKDDSAAVIRRYSQVKAIFKSNGGQTSAVRAGLDSAKGDIIIFLDADDVLYPEACAEVANAWDSATSYVQYKLRVFSADCPDLGTNPPRPFVEDPKRFLLKWGRFPFAPTSGNAFSKRWAEEILRVTNIPDRAFCDQTLAMCSALCGEVRSIERCLGGYRVHKKNVSWDWKLKDSYFDAVMVEQQIRRFASHMGLELDRERTLTGPYHYQSAIKLYFKDLLSAQEAKIAARRSLKSFATFPGLQPMARAKNIAVGLIVVASPPLAKFLFRKRVTWEPSPLPSK